MGSASKTEMIEKKVKVTGLARQRVGVPLLVQTCVNGWWNGNGRDSRKTNVTKSYKGE